MRFFDLRRLLGGGGGGGHRAPDPEARRTDARGRGGGRGGAGRARAVDPPADGLPDPEAAYGHGVADGRKALDPDHFRRYLEHTLEEQELDARLATLDEREETLAARLGEVRERRARSTARAVEAEHLRERTDAATDRLNAVEREIEAAERDRAGLRKPGLLGYTVMFGVAAVAFILADLVITRAIVADALALTGRSFLGIDEAWYFASALALVAVLLKPGYDRLVEADYWEGDGRWFTATILVASVLALATLFVLGVFRTVAFEAQTLQDLALEASGGEIGEQMAELRELQRAVVTSMWGKAAFVMSGVLFAVAGAICLGISLRHYYDFRHLRLRPWRRRRSLRTQRRRLTKRRGRDAIALRDARADIRRAELRLEHLPAADRLRERLEAVREERDGLLERRAVVRRERFTILYTAGYRLGRKLGDPDARPRPHVAVRRSIRAAFDGADGAGARDGADGGAPPIDDGASATGDGAAA